jgi:hypothetical protein
MILLALVCVGAAARVGWQYIQYRQGDEIYSQAEQLIQLPDLTQLPAPVPDVNLPSGDESQPTQTPVTEEPVPPVYVDPYADALAAMDFTALWEVNDDILGWILICIAVGIGLSAVFQESGRIGKGIAAVLFAVAGGWLVNHPLALAAWIGRIIGVLLVIDGVQDMTNLRKVGKPFLMPLIATAVGVILVVMPMATSRLVFTLCGIVVLIIGIGMLLERLRGKKRLEGPKDDIIDAL